MKLAFIYGAANFYKGKDGLYYSGGTVDCSVWDRYLKYFDEIVALGKKMDKIPPDFDLTLISMDRVEIKVMSPLNGFKTLLTQIKKVEKECFKTLSDSDCAIIRLPSVEGLIACEVAKKMNKPYLIEVVGCAHDSLWYHGSIKGKFAAKPLGFLNKRAIKQAPYAIYVTEEYLQAKYPCKGIHYACSDVNVISDMNILEIRKEKNFFDVSDKKIKIGMIGSLNVYYKGHKDALKSLKYLTGQGFGIELHLIGAGEIKSLEKELKELEIEDLVIFKGLIPSGSEVINWLDELDIFIMPSLTEGLPRSLVEAMSRAIPCVGSNVGGIPELLEKRFLHEPGDYIGLSNKIIELLTDRELYMKTAERNWFFSQKFSTTELDAKRTEVFSEFKKFSVIKGENQ